MNEIPTCVVDTEEEKKKGHVLQLCRKDGETQRENSPTSKESAAITDKVRNFCLTQEIRQWTIETFGENETPTPTQLPQVKSK